MAKEPSAIEDDGVEDDLEFDTNAAYIPAPKSRSNVYTAMLILSAMFYLIALLATFLELAPYTMSFAESRF